MSPKKVYIIAGEASGDLHGSNLVKELKRLSPELSIRFWGGERMSKLIGEPVKHIRDLAFMGFWEVVTNLKTITRNIRFCKEDIANFQPDCIVFIDYPGFNLRIAEWAKAKGIETHYYISPQVWAWKENRVKKIKASVDHLYCILPFEKDFYKKHAMEVNYVGHPLLDEIAHFRQTAPSKEEFYLQNGLDDKPIIAVLPGSRKQEVLKKLPIMLNATKGFSDYQIVVAGAPILEEAFYRQVLNGVEAKIIYGQTYSLLEFATAGVVTSGTATLETALFKVPQVVCYIGNKLSYLIAKRLIKISYISLVNLIMDEEIVKELIQDECTKEMISNELKEILPFGNKREHISLKYEELIQKLGEGGASLNVAKGILKLN